MMAMILHKTRANRQNTVVCAHGVQNTLIDKYIYL